MESKIQPQQFAFVNKYVRVDNLQLRTYYEIPFINEQQLIRLHTLFKHIKTTVYKVPYATKYYFSYNNNLLHPSHFHHEKFTLRLGGNAEFSEGVKLLEKHYLTYKDEIKQMIKTAGTYVNLYGREDIIYRFPVTDHFTVLDKDLNANQYEKKLPLHYWARNGKELTKLGGDLKLLISTSEKHLNEEVSADLIIALDTIKVTIIFGNFSPNPEEYSDWRGIWMGRCLHHPALYRRTNVSTTIQDLLQLQPGMNMDNHPFCEKIYYNAYHTYLPIKEFVLRMEMLPLKSIHFYKVGLSQLRDVESITDGIEQVHDQFKLQYTNEKIIRQQKIIEATESYVITNKMPEKSKEIFNVTFGKKEVKGIHVLRLLKHLSQQFQNHPDSEVIQFSEKRDAGLIPIQHSIHLPINCLLRKEIEELFQMVEFIENSNFQELEKFYHKWINQWISPNVAKERTERVAVWKQFVKYKLEKFNFDAESLFRVPNVDQLILPCNFLNEPHEKLPAQFSTLDLQGFSLKEKQVYFIEAFRRIIDVEDSDNDEDLQDEEDEEEMF